MNKRITILAVAVVIVIVTVVAIKQVVLQKQQAQSAKRITQYSKNETVKDYKTPNTGESVEKSSTDTDKSALAQTNNVRSHEQSIMANPVSFTLNKLLVYSHHALVLANLDCGRGRYDWRIYDHVYM
ncbi:MAG: hypothetical protein ACYTF1_02265 [Planctomycetota bacterium]|jgi:predicted PurR-regulated permease PerM